MTISPVIQHLPPEFDARQLEVVGHTRRPATGSCWTR